MSGNLVVISRGKICFSDYIRKPNQLLTKLDIINFVDVVGKRFIIPLKQEGLLSMTSAEPDPVFKKDIISNGPLNVTFHGDSCLSETNVSAGKLKSTPIFWGGFNKYCRSDLSSLESAASAAQVIYNDALTISKEAYKACGINPPPFLYGNIADFKKPLDDLYNINEKLSSLEKKSKKFKQYEKLCLETYDLLYSYFKP